MRHKLSDVPAQELLAGDPGSGPSSFVIAYRGYLICKSNAGLWIEKDKFLICWAKDTEDAKKQIDGLF